VAIACVSALLPVHDECIHFFHKSVKDWLIEKSNYGQHQFSVDEKEGHEVLSKLCIDELDEVKRKGIDGAQFPDTTKYALRHGVQHMLQQEDVQVRSLEEVVTKFVLDVELVYAKLCVNVTLAFEDVVCVQKQVGVEKCHEALNTLLVLLRKHILTLENQPHTIFQTLLNEGGPELSSQALNLLETKYSEVAYMEYLHKKDLQGRVQARFQCSAPVLCFDVSPQLDYMVCECYGSTIELWSLHTGRQLWKRDVKVTEDYFFEYSGFSKKFESYSPLRKIENCYYYHYGRHYNDYDLCPPRLLYRSVVFHPTKDLVLTGVLSHAYTFDGDLKPLFLSSKCCFMVCSISADKMKMLTDCPNDTKSIVMWSLTDGSEINRFTWSDDILSFAWSRDGRLLAISDLSASLTLVDVMDDYRTLAQTTISKVCGMIKFSPDCRCLYALVLTWASCHFFPLDIIMENDGDFSLDVLPDQAYYHPWEFEACGETGFLLGDPFCLPSEGNEISSLEPELAFVLNEKSVLKGASGDSTIEMLQLDQLTKESARVSITTAKKVALSLDGDTLYVITTTDGSLETLVGWDISSGTFKPGKRVLEGGFKGCNLVAVREGVLWQTSHDVLELWNFELSDCIRSWRTGLRYIHKVIPISEERVAFKVLSASEEESKVIIVDTTREGIASTITIRGYFIGCNSKCHVITHHNDDLQMQCGDKVLWKKSMPSECYGRPRCMTFSPTEQYCVTLVELSIVFVWVFDAVSGKELHVLQPSTTRLTPTMVG